MNTVNIFFALDLHFLYAQYTHHQLENANAKPRRNTISLHTAAI